MGLNISEITVCQILDLEMAGNNFFEEVSHNSGISYVGRSKGSAWGDFNGDTWPDLYVSNYWGNNNPGIIYLNKGNGSFTEVTTEVLSPISQGDHFAAAWADFDNDGDQDLLQVAGASNQNSNQNLLYINDEGIFLWQDEEDFWHLRMTGSQEGSRYVGSIVSDQAASFLHVGAKQWSVSEVPLDLSGW